MKKEDAPLNIDDREKELLFGIYNRILDIRENYTGISTSPLSPGSSDRQQGTLVADATTEMDQAPDSFLRPKRYDMINLKELPAETLDDFDITFRKPNATGGRVKLFTGSGDYGKKYLKNKDKSTQERFNKIVNDLSIDMSFDSAISEALRQIREEIK